MTVLHDNAGNAIDQSNPLATEIESSNAIVPGDLQSRLQTTIQTHNAVSVALSGNSIQASWMDCDGYNDIAVTMLNDAATSSTIDIQWSNDGSTVHGVDYSIISNTNTSKAVFTQIKARYAKVRLINGDSGAAHTMSAWAYLKC